MAWKITLGRIRAIAGVAFQEIIQHPVIVLLMFLAVSATLVTPLFQFQQFAEDGRLARDSGLASLFLFGVLIAAGAAMTQVASEITSGIASAALTKPVERATYLIGKYLGVVTVLLLFSVTQTMATLLAERISPHYQRLEVYADTRVFFSSFLCMIAVPLLAALWQRFRNGRFHLTACLLLPFFLLLALALSGSREPMGEFRYWPLNLQTSLIPAAWLVFSGLAVVAAAAVSLATRFSGGAVMLATALLFMLGFLQTLFTGLLQSEGWRRFLFAWLPDFQLFWQCDALAHGGRIALLDVWQISAYGACFILLFLSCGVLVFRTRDIG